MSFWINVSAIVVAVMGVFPLVVCFFYPGASDENARTGATVGIGFLLAAHFIRGFA